MVGGGSEIDKAPEPTSAGFGRCFAPGGAGKELGAGAIVPKGQRVSARGFNRLKPRDHVPSSNRPERAPDQGLKATCKYCAISRASIRSPLRGIGRPRKSGLPICFAEGNSKSVHAVMSLVWAVLHKRVRPHQSVYMRDRTLDLPDTDARR